MTVAYSLHWPEGWARTSARKSGHKFGQTRELTFDRARNSLSKELKCLGASNMVLSTNLPVRLDGMPYAEAARKTLPDPGVAVYFTYKGRQMVMAQDEYQYIAANMRSLALAIEAMRQLERHGGGGAMMERAFTGFAALPAPKSPWKILGLDGAAPKEAIEQAYRDLAKKLHPDAGGSAEKMAELNDARQRALAI
jgi:hypothetical protein